MVVGGCADLKEVGEIESKTEEGEGPSSQLLRGCCDGNFWSDSPRQEAVNLVNFCDLSHPLLPGVVVT